MHTSAHMNTFSHTHTLFVVLFLHMCCVQICLEEEPISTVHFPLSHEFGESDLTARRLQVMIQC